VPKVHQESQGTPAGTGIRAPRVTQAAPAIRVSWVLQANEELPVRMGTMASRAREDFPELWAPPARLDPWATKALRELTAGRAKKVPSAPRVTLGPLDTKVLLDPWVRVEMLESEVLPVSQERWVPAVIQVFRACRALRATRATKETSGLLAALATPATLDHLESRDTMEVRVGQVIAVPLAFRALVERLVLEASPELKATTVARAFQDHQVAMVHPARMGPTAAPASLGPVAQMVRAAHRAKTGKRLHWMSFTAL